MADLTESEGEEERFSEVEERRAARYSKIEGATSRCVGGSALVGVFSSLSSELYLGENSIDFAEVMLMERVKLIHDDE